MNHLPTLLQNYTHLDKSSFLKIIQRLTSSAALAIQYCFSCEGIGWKRLRLPHIGTEHTLAHTSDHTTAHTAAVLILFLTIGVVECINSVPLERASTIHMPLNRLLALTVGQTMRCLNAPYDITLDDNVFWDKREVTLRELLPETFGDRDIMSSVIDGPLHTLLLCAQIAAGMWNKNGQMTMEG